MLWVGDDKVRRDVERCFGADFAGLGDAEVVRFGGEVGGDVVCEFASGGYGIGVKRMGGEVKGGEGETRTRMRVS